MSALSTPHKIFSGDIRRALLLALIDVALLLIVSAFLPQSQGFRSAELKFTDASSKGLAIVPASCPSYPYHPSEVSGSGCSGNDAYVQYGDCSIAIVRTCGYRCQAGTCLVPPPIGFAEFSATVPPSDGGGGGGGSTFTATGHLQVKPLLVRSGNKVRLYWNASNVASCTVTGTNGDSWAAVSSGASGVQSGSITGQTIYTLYCNALPDADVPYISEQQTVNIIPVFQET